MSGSKHHRIIIFLTTLSLHVIIYSQQTVNVTGVVSEQAFDFGTSVDVSLSPTDDGTLDKVELILNRGTPETLTSPYTFSYADLIPGSYHLQAVATYSSGNVTEDLWFVIKPRPFDPLPAPPAANGKLKVFLLAGQSNMVGFGELTDANGNPGTMEYYLERQPDDYAHLVDNNGNPLTRDDVWIVNLSQDGQQGWLTVGYGAGASQIGPEYAFGWVMGDYYEDPVLLIKSSWGGRSLAVNFLSPSSADYPVPAADGDSGWHYSETVRHVEEVLGNLGTYYPEFAGTEYEIMGMGWHQGWNDRICAECVNAYEGNMVNFIKDIRTDIGVEDMPFSIANTGFGGWDIVGSYKERVENLMQFQLDVADPALHPEFEGNVGAIETREFARHRELCPSGQDYHWYRNWETYYLVGESMAHQIIQLRDSGNVTEVLPESIEPVASHLLIQSAGQGNVNFNLTQSVIYTISVIDLARGVLLNKISGQGLKGANHIQLDFKNMPQGVHYLRLTAGGQVTGKIISRIGNHTKK